MANAMLNFDIKSTVIKIMREPATIKIKRKKIK